MIFSMVLILAFKEFILKFLEVYFDDGLQCIEEGLGYAHTSSPMGI